MEQTSLILEQDKVTHNRTQPSELGLGGCSHLLQNLRWNWLPCPM